MKVALIISSILAALASPARAATIWDVYSWFYPPEPDHQHQLYSHRYERALTGKPYRCRVSNWQAGTCIDVNGRTNFSGERVQK